MRAAVIVDGRVDNIVEVERLDLIEGLYLVDAKDADIGDLWDGVNFIKPTPPPPTDAEIISASKGAIQQLLDSTAVAYGYDSLLSMASYAEEPSVERYQTEGRAARKWRSLCWAKAEEVQAAVKAGDRTAPSPNQLVAEMPDIELPAPSL